MAAATHNLKMPSNAVLASKAFDYGTEFYHGKRDPQTIAKGAARTAGTAYGDKAMNMGSATGKKAAKKYIGVFENMPRIVMRTLQFLLGIIVVGFYGHRIAANKKNGNSQSAEWLFGVFVAGVSCVTAVLFFAAGVMSTIFSKIRPYRMFWWDLTLFILWIIVFGVFAVIFLKRDNGNEYKGASPRVQKCVVWLDLVNALLWLISGVYGSIKTFLGNSVNGLEAKLKGKVRTTIAGEHKGAELPKGFEMV